MSFCHAPFHHLHIPIFPWLPAFARARAGQPQNHRSRRSRRPGQRGGMTFGEQKLKVIYVIWCTSLGIISVDVFWYHAVFLEFSNKSLQSRFLLRDESSLHVRSLHVVIVCSECVQVEMPWKCPTFITITRDRDALKQHKTKHMKNPERCKH